MYNLVFAQPQTAIAKHKTITIFFILELQIQKSTHYRMFL